MKFAMKQRAFGLAVAATVALSLVLGLTFLLGNTRLALWLMSTVLFGVLIFAYFDLKARIDDGIVNSKEELETRLWNNYAQSESFYHLMRLLGDVPPLPSTRDWAISPDCAVILAQQVLERKPDVVIEFGSGVSTLVIGHCLKRNGKGKLLSFDHSDTYIAKTAEYVKHHGLADLVDLNLAELKAMPDSPDEKWYDIDCVTKKCAGVKAGLVFIDGPPTLLGGTRAPAAEVLKNALAPESVFVLDDTAREHEQEFLKTWRSKYNAEVGFLRTEKGTAIVTMTAKAGEVDG